MDSFKKPTGTGKFRAVIFDMDGVITDSEPFYAEAINEVLRGTGNTLTREDHEAILGSSIDETWEWVVRRFGLPGAPAHWLGAYDHAVLRLLSSKAEPAAGLYTLLDGIEARGIKIGLASSSQHNWVLAVLARLHVEGRFQFVAACEMVKEAKPAPDLYLLAARGLDVEPSACLALEDSPRGIHAGKAAGMVTIALRSALAASLDTSEADYFIDRLEDFPLAWL